MEYYDMRLFFCILLISGCGLFNPEKYNPNPRPVVEEACCDKEVFSPEPVDVVERIKVFFTDTAHVGNLMLDTNLVSDLITEYVYVADPSRSDFDSIFVSVIEYVKLVTVDTLYIDDIDYTHKTVYIEVSDEVLVRDTIVEIQNQDVIISNVPNIQEILDESFGNNKVYDLNGKIIRRPKGVYIENGKIKYINNLK
jgi:hypothetical protein